jgi:hypothetical protein
MCHYKIKTVFLALILTSIGCGVSESQVEKYLSSMDIRLKDNFKIEDSKWSTAPGDMMQKFQLYISAKDTKSTIEKIRKLENFREYKLDEDLPSIMNVDQKTPFKILAYKQGDIYYYGIYDEVNKSGYELQEFTLDSKTMYLDFIFVEE